jgi:putative FmdB family regulatory protein
MYRIKVMLQQNLMVQHLGAGMPCYEYLCKKCGVLEIMHGIKEEDKTVCPTCGLDGLEKLISLPAGFIVLGREANQYNDILKSKHWRDKNGDLHKVKPGDGHTKSGGVGKRQKASPEQIAAKKNRDEAIRKKRREKMAYRNFERRMIEKAKRK